MSRFYKTAKAAPIVDYTVDYPFDDLFKATKYKNDLQDTREEKLNQAYDDVLGLNFIPGTVDDNGHYIESPSEKYVKQKRAQVEDLINQYSNVDLTKNAWGNINRQITQLTNDPTLADIQTSYNNYIKQIAHQRELDKAGRLPTDPWGPAGDPTELLWDVDQEGIYPFHPAPGFDDPSLLLERYYKDMNIDEELVFDPITNAYITKKEVKQEDLDRVASGVDETFLSTPAGKDAVANYRQLNPDSYNLSDLEVAKKIVQDYGQKYLGMDIGAVSGQNKSNNNRNKPNQFDLGVVPGPLMGTEWALNNNTTTPTTIADKIFTPLGDGIYTVDAGTNVYINPVELDRTGTADDLILSYNVGIIKRYLQETKGLQTELDALIEPAYAPFSPREQSTLDTYISLLNQRIEMYDKDGDGDITEADLPGGKTNPKVVQFYDRVEYYTDRKKRILAANEKEHLEYKTKKTELQNQLDEIAVSYAGKYSVDVTDPALREVMDKWSVNPQDIEDMDLNTDDLMTVMSLELTDLANRGGVWQHINDAPTRNMIVDRDQDNLPVSAKFVQGNMLFTYDQLENWFTEKGYGTPGTWFGIDTGPDDWDNAFVGPDSDHHLFDIYTPSPASDLYVDADNDGTADQIYYLMPGAWRQVNDNWTVANNINTYTTGQGRGEEMAYQREIYNQGRAMQMNDAIFGSLLEQNLAQSWVNTKRVYGDNAVPGSLGVRERVQTNINDFIEDAHNSGDPEKIDVATALEKYLTDNGLWKDGYNSNSTFGTGTIMNKNITTSDNVPAEYKMKPWLYSGNEDAMKISKFVDMFYNPIETVEQRSLITDFVAGWEGDGSYGGVTYIQNDKLVDVPTYKKAASAKAERMGLNLIEGDMYSNINLKSSVYAPYATNGTKMTIHNLNTIAAGLDTEFSISGLYRTPEYNRTLPGADLSNSSHIDGRAIDMSLNDEFQSYLDNSQQVTKDDVVGAGQWYTVYNTNGAVMFRVLKEDDHYHIESPK